jgi:hypothetical protein
MKTVDLRAWGWHYGLPLLIFVASIPVILGIGELTGDDLDFLLFFGVFPMLSLLVGLLFRPPHAWVIPAIVLVAFLAVASWSMYVLDQGPTQKPDPAAFVLLFVFVVGLPMTVLIWIGRSLREAYFD